MLQTYFRDRVDAGEKLARLLENYKRQDAVVYALPRGGVVIGVEVAKKLKLPLDLIITRKIGHPNQPEYAIGAVAENGHAVLNKDEVSNVDEEYLKDEIERQRQEAIRRRTLYLGKRNSLSCKGKTAIVVDDGIATGFTMRAAIQELKLHYKPEKIIVAVPVIPKNKVYKLEAQGCEIIAIITTSDFLGSIGAYYENFNPVEDKAVIKIINSL